MIATVYFLKSKEETIDIMAGMEVDQTFLFVDKNGLGSRVTYHGGAKGWQVEFLRNILVAGPGDNFVVPLAELVDGMQVNLTEQDT